jgi:hypothetical protein
MPQRYVGRAPQQVQRFIEHVVDPIRQRHRDQLQQAAELRV